MKQSIIKYFMKHVDKKEIITENKEYIGIHKHDMTKEHFKSNTHIEIKSLERYNKSNFEVKQETKIIITDKLKCPVCKNLVDYIEHGKNIQCGRCKNYLLTFGNSLYVGII